jgi:very-short-patch-repair endonuclease
MAAVLACGPGAFLDEREAMLARHAGRPGAPALRAVLESGQPRLTRSEAEDRFLQLVQKGDLPLPEANVMVQGYEVDFLWRSAGLAVEVDGFGFHASRRSFENDRRRDAELAANGIHVIRVTWRHVVEEPHATLVRVAQALTRSRADRPFAHGRGP